MQAQIVFLSLFLGLIAGRQPVEVQVSPQVKSVRILVDGREAALMKAAPWSAIVDLGSSFQPRELAAIAYDRDGDETGRTSQTINLPRPPAELTIGLQTDDKGTPAAVSLRWEHVFAAKPSRATIQLDRKKLTVDSQFHAPLPRLDPAQPHVISAEMRFADGVVARRELVVAGGAVTDSISTELTPVVFSGTLSQKNTTLEGCLSAHGTAVNARAVETPDAQVFVVREPDAKEVRSALNSASRSVSTSWRDALTERHRLALDSGTAMRYTWPIATHLAESGHIPANVFATSAIFPSSDFGMLAFLTLGYDAANNVQRAVAEPRDNPRRFADAVAVAGVNAITGAHRRAVVLVLSGTVDYSRSQPAAVRHYLASVGVPLFVWSPTGPQPHLKESWGDVDDISTQRHLAKAVQRLRDSLASQHVVWLAADPLTALRVEADPRCGVKPLAELGH